MLIDTHCHLNDSSKFDDVSLEIGLAREAGVEAMIVVGVQPGEWESTLNLVVKHRELWCILGWHPNYTKEYDEEEARRLVGYAGHPKCLAIGEIGLDYHWDYSPRATQVQALSAQLDLAVECSLPVVFHAREAYGDLLSLLETRPEQPYLFHCFAGTESEAARAVELDSYFGVDGPVTYKKSDELRRVITGLPLERIVLETDAPYMSPVPFRGKVNRPAYVSYVNEALALLKGISKEECAAVTTANARRFFTKIEMP